MAAAADGIRPEVTSVELTAGGLAAPSRAAASIMPGPCGFPLACPGARSHLIRMSQNDAIIATQSLSAEAERLHGDAEAMRREAEALRSAIQAPSGLVQQAIARLEAEAGAKTERAQALERVAATLLSRDAAQGDASPEGFDAFAKANLSPLLVRLASAVRGQGHAAYQPGPNAAAAIDLQAIGRIVENGLDWLARERRRQDGRP